MHRHSVGLQTSRARIMLEVSRTILSGDAYQIWLSYLVHAKICNVKQSEG